MIPAIILGLLALSIALVFIWRWAARLADRAWTGFMLMVEASANPESMTSNCERLWHQQRQALDNPKVEVPGHDV